MRHNEDGSYASLGIGSRVRVDPVCNPSGTGFVTREDAFSATVKLDKDGREYGFGKSVLDKIETNS
jgi:hypothetical protein